MGVWVLGAVGAILVVLAIGVSLAYWSARSAAEKRLAGDVTPQSPFDGVRAFADLEKVVGFGPRPSGSEALVRLRGFVRKELEGDGLEVREQAFVADTPLGKRDMVNVIGVLPGTKPGIIILGNHYETKYFNKITFVGANDGGSTTAWMLEMARVLAAESDRSDAGLRRKGRTVWFCFFDGEEAFGAWSATDGLYGSRAFVEYLRERGELGQVAAMVNVDMIGDRYLGISKDRDAPDWLTKAIWDEARRLGYGDHFIEDSRAIEDDHVPFRRAGIPAIDLIDFQTGPTAFHHPMIWHTQNDTLDKCSAASLQVVGDVVYYALADIEARLDALPRAVMERGR